MLKSTYRQVSSAPDVSPLPAGWTEHKAPTGHTYYYNAETKKSTYTRPQGEPEEILIDYNATAPDNVVQASMKALDEFHKNNRGHERGQGHFSGGRSYQDRSRRDKRQDRPKSKRLIDNCAPWVLVMTKYGRRFVHNTETKESFWKFPSDVMMAVIEMEKQDWQTKQNKSEEANQAARAQSEQKTMSDHGAAPGTQQAQDYDSDEYEEVEVTDDDEEESSAKRQRTEEPDIPAQNGPVEFDEDDIAWQLAQMEEDGLDDDEYDREIEDEEDGLPLTDEDTKALFRSLLDDMRIDPFAPFDSLLEKTNAAIVDDDRWVSLSTMAARRDAFKNWSRDRILERKAREAAEGAKKKRDPKVEYMVLLQEHATPKLYWPEFKRKFRKEQAMKDLHLNDKEREKLYREYISKLKATEADRKKEFVALLKSIKPGKEWNRNTNLEGLPDDLVRDLRFYSIRDKRARDDLVEAHLSTLDSA